MFVIRVISRKVSPSVMYVSVKNFPHVNLIQHAEQFASAADAQDWIDKNYHQMEAFDNEDHFVDIIELEMRVVNIAQAVLVKPEPIERIMPHIVYENVQYFLTTKQGGEPGLTTNASEANTFTNTDEVEQAVKNTVRYFERLRDRSITSLSSQTYQNLIRLLVNNLKTAQVSQKPVLQ